MQNISKANVVAIIPRLYILYYSFGDVDLFILRQQNRMVNN